MGAFFLSLIHEVLVKKYESFSLSLQIGIGIEIKLGVGKKTLRVNDI